MTEKKDLINPNGLENKIASSNNVDYFANKLKEHDITGIRYERKYANGNSESLSVWREDGKIKRTLTINQEK